MNVNECVTGTTKKPPCFRYMMIEIWMHVREGDRGHKKDSQMLRFPFTLMFHVGYKSIQSNLNVKTL